MHQPLYKDALTGRYTLPWVRLHAVKDYLHMAEVLARHPRMRATFNFVPSLVEQIEDYAAGRAEDSWAAVSRKRLLDAEDKRFMLQSFFAISRDRFISRYPRYWRLLELRNTVDGDVELLSDGYYRDLAAWFNLAWIEPSTIAAEPALAALVEKGGGFTLDEVETILDHHRRICARVLPIYRELQARGQVELSTSPYYHPILPLLLDSRAAREASPQLTLPNALVHHPEDAAEHLRLARDAHQRTFGSPARGLWPSEGAVSHAVGELLTSCPSADGWTWAASDESIVAASCGVGVERDGDGNVTNPRFLYQPYRFAGTELALIFRDRVLSDRIGFVYRHFEGREAARDLVARLRRIHDQLKDDAEPYLVPIVLDGENCWEEYADNGTPFLDELYRLLSDDESLEPVTLSAYLDRHPPRARVERLRAGSWIFGNLETWIGEDEQNRAWDYLALTRARLVAWEKENPSENGESRAAAWRALYTAEGSDWFWWYYSRNKFGQEHLFDQEFRSHLGSVYLAIGLPIPPWLQRPIVGDPPPRFGLPGGYVDPRLSASPQAALEWAGAGFVDARRSTGVMQQGGGLVGRLYFGYNPADLHIRLEAMEDLTPFSVGFYLLTEDAPANARPRFADDATRLPVGLAGLTWEIAVPPHTSGRAVIGRADGGEAWHSEGELASVERKGGVVELRVPLDRLGLRLGDSVGWLVALARDRRIVEVFPGGGDEPERLTFTLVPEA